MDSEKKQPITVATTVKAPVEKAWKAWTNPDDITEWNSASDDWHSPRAENDLRRGGKFNVRMEAKDGSVGFDFGGEYDDVKEYELIEYTMDDGRQVSVRFTHKDGETLVEETFDPEDQNSIELQRNGWQAIMDNYKKHVEKL